VDGIACVAFLVWYFVESGSELPHHIYKHFPLCGVGFDIPPWLVKYEGLQKYAKNQKTHEFQKWYVLGGPKTVEKPWLIYFVQSRIGRDTSTFLRIQSRVLLNLYHWRLDLNGVTIETHPLLRSESFGRRKTREKTVFLLFQGFIFTNISTSTNS